MVFYLDGLYRPFQCLVSTLRYKKGERRLRDYALDWGAQLSKIKSGVGL